MSMSNGPVLVPETTTSVLESPTDTVRDRVGVGRTFVSLAHADQAAHDLLVNTGDTDHRVLAGAGGDWQQACTATGP